jgi:hypothetical protein
LDDTELGTAGSDRKETSVTEDSTQQPRGNWSEVGRQFEELGRVLRGHFERERAAAEGGPAAPTDASGVPGAAGAESAGAGAGKAGPDDASASGSAARDRAAMRDALHRLEEAAKRLGEHAGEAVRDPAVRTSAQQAAYSLREALEATFSELGEGLRGRMRARRGSGPTSEDTTSQRPEPPREIGGSSEPPPAP